MKENEIILIERPIVGNEYSVGDITIKEFTNFPKDLSNSIVVESFPSHTLTGILSGGYLIDQLKLPLIGCFTSKKFPPRCVIENGHPSHPIRIFGNGKLIVITGEFKPVGEELTSSLVEAIISFGKRHRVKLVLGVEGLPTQQNGKEEIEFDKAPLQYVAVSKWFHEEMNKFGAKPITSGVIAGLAGLTLAEGSLTNGIDLGLIVAPSDSEKRYKDTFSAINVVNVLKKLIDFEMDTEDLVNKAKSLTLKTDKLLSEDQKSKEGPLSPSLSRIYI